MARRAANGKPSRPNGDKAPAVSLAIVTYEAGSTLGECLAAVRAQTFPDFELIVIDNASKDGAAQAAAVADPGIRLVANDENLGFAAAVNQAARMARGRWLALLNPDAFADPDWLARLVGAGEAHPNVRSFASRQLMADDPSKLDGLGDVMAL